MKQRVISGAVLVVILAVTLYFGGAVTCAFMGLVSLIGNMELLRVYGVNRKLPGIVCYLATIFYYVAYGYNNPYDGDISFGYACCVCTHIPNIF